MNFKLSIDKETMGITCKSLKRLRDELARRIDHSITVWEIQTSELCCGFLIFDYDAAEAVWSGDGFRTDGEGEGGAGYKTAHVLLSIYNINPFYWHLCNSYTDIDDLKKQLNSKLEEMGDEAIPQMRINERIPSYIRNI